MPKYVLITGKIAYRALVKLIEQTKLPMELEVKALKCTVAALMTTDFIARKLKEEGTLTGEEILIIPGLCQGSLEVISQATGCQVWRGPKDLKDLPGFLRGERQLDSTINEKELETTSSPIKILAEIVNAPRMSKAEIMGKAHYYREHGADYIDIGGDTAEPFPDLGNVIRELKAEGFKVSLDSHLKEDILTANKAGVDLILSLSSHNLELARVLDCPIVLIPDEEDDLGSLYQNMEKLAQWNRSFIIDPILPPLTMGVAQAISRYGKVRGDFPESELLMGLGNITELIDADSTGVNALMVGIASELNVNYILTTEVSHRTRGSVMEINIARGLMNQALAEGRLPKHINYGLLTIKDPFGHSFDETELREMYAEIKDSNYRIFVDENLIYMFNGVQFLQGRSTEEIFTQLTLKEPSHAFYLGRELGKAELALKLGKKYVQDDPLRWGYMW